MTNGISQIDHCTNGPTFAGTRARGQGMFNPATGAGTGQVALATANEGAVAAAQVVWADMPPICRARLNRFLSVLNDHNDDLVRAITAEHGKVFSDARDEVERGIDIAEFAIPVSR